jgi:hypothetical protein
MKKALERVLLVIIGILPRRSMKHFSKFRRKKKKRTYNNWKKKPINLKTI